MSSVTPSSPLRAARFRTRLPRSQCRLFDKGSRGRSGPTRLRLWLPDQRQPIDALGQRRTLPDRDLRRRVDGTVAGTDGSGRGRPAREGDGLGRAELRPQPDLEVDITPAAGLGPFGPDDLGSRSGWRNAMSHLLVALDLTSGGAYAVAIASNA